VRIQRNRYTARMTNECSSTLLVIGALHIDEIASAAAPIIVGESNPVNWSKSAGGVAANVARAAAQSAQLSPVLLANIGEGRDALELSSALAHANVKVLPVKGSGTSAGRYSAILQDTGELLVGLADVEQAQEITLSKVEKLISLESAHTVVLDTNLSSTSLVDISRTVRHNHASCLIAALGVSPSKITRLHKALPYIDILFCNKSEVCSLATGISAEISTKGSTATLAKPSTESSNAASPDLKKPLRKLCKSGCKHIVMTCGESKIQIHSKDQHTELRVQRINNTYTVNGPGDALAGATLAGLRHEKLTHDSLVQAVNQLGITAAAKVITGEHKAPNLFNH